MRLLCPAVIRLFRPLLLGVTLLAVGVPALAQRIDDGITAHYPFEGNLDEAAGIDTRPVVRGTLGYGAGAVGRGLLVSGDDEIDFTGIPASTFSGDFTIAWFMNLDSSEAHRIFSKETTCSDTANQFYAAVDARSPARLGFHLSSLSARATAVASVPRKQWVHVALVRSGSQATVYVDGKPGTPAALPALSLGSITAPFGLGNSPCIGRELGGPTRPSGRFDELRIYPSALTADKIAALSRRPSFTATPSSATGGGRIMVRASHLVVDRNYELRLVGATRTTLVARAPATASSMEWPVTLPTLAPGRYELQLVSTLLRSLENVDRQIAFTVGAPLSITPSSALQAGKRASFTVGNLLRGGSTRLLYGGRVLAGPVAADSTTHRFDVVLPSDFPAGLPTSVSLRAEQLQGRTASHVGTASAPVAAPFSGRFAVPQLLSADRTLAPPEQPVRLTAKLGLNDGATARNTEVSAYWVGDDGQVTPLPTSSLALADDGSLRLDTRPPSLGAMTAVVPKTPGRIRLVMKRTNEFGRTEWEVEEGPTLQTSFDFDPDTDITVRVLRRGTQETVPLEGAYVVVSSAAPLGYALPPPAGNDGASGSEIGGGSLYQHRQPKRDRFSVDGKSLIGTGPAVNQVNNDIVDLPPPPAPACGESLYRRYTDSTGRAEFPVLGGPEEEPASWQMAQAMQITAAECVGLSCQTAQPLRIYEFDLAVYTLHLGAGYRDNLTRAEVPTRFGVSYNRDTETFTITNRRTGETTVQQVSANLTVEVPTITGTDNFITFDDPLMYHEIGGQPINLVARHQGGFGRWIDFTGTRVSEFVNPSPDKVIQFGHRPDANGSISRAQLFVRNLNGNFNAIGEFEQVSFVDGCNLQDDPANNRAETWRLKLSPAFENSWRFPQGVFFPVGGEPRSCGYIQAENARGGSGRLNLCFHWQKAPGFMYGRGGPVVVNDADMLDVQIEESGSELGAGATMVPKRDTDFLGEPLDKPGQIDNQTNARNGVFASIGPNGPTSGTRQLTGNNPKQFSEGAAGERQLLNVANGGATVQIGSTEYQTILDTTIPLFQWYWGIPEIISAEVYARLRIVAKYLFSGTLTTTSQGEQLDMLTNAVFFAMVSIGVDIDVLLGLIVDAGASLTGTILSEMPVKVTDGESDGLEPCFQFRLDFSYYVDPCPICPTPRIEDTENILNERAPSNCVLYSTTKAGREKGGDPDLAALASAKRIDFGFEQARSLRRQPALAFDRQGSGQMMMLDDNRSLTASAVSNDSLAPAVVLSAAKGIRDPQVAYFDTDRAVAVWSENALPESTFVASTYLTIARNQRIAWSLWDGEQWSDKQFLTEPGPGEGQVTLVACPVGQAGCPAGGEVLVVWQRDANANAQAPQYRLWFAQFRPDSGFSAPASLDPSPTAGVQDITPAATYANGLPVVVWTRQFGGTLNNFSQRNLAYRVLPDGNPIAVAAAPGASAPSITATPSGSSIRVAWLRADENTSSNPNAPNAGAVGTQHALHVSQATCTTTTCSFPEALVPPTRDQMGRRIYGERPRLIRGENDVFVVMRAFRFEGDNNEPVQPGDPVGTVMNSADVVLVAPNYSTGIARVTALTADGATHMGVFAAYNPAQRSILSGSSVFVPPFIGQMRDALKATGYTGHRAYAKTVANTGPIELRSTVDASDLAVEQVVAQTALAPSTTQTTRVVIGNRGGGYSASRDGLVNIELRWNSPGGPVLATTGVASIGAGGERSVEVTWTAPADAHTDETHVLHVALLPPAGFDEITDDNNRSSLDFPGLPTPQNLASSAIPGIPQVQLGWDPIDDDRIAGYRVYREEADGRWMPLGGSPTYGFLDLSASFNQPRRYAVSSYSARGIESPLSEPISVMPVPTLVAEGELLKDGFEAIP